MKTKRVSFTIEHMLFLWKRFRYIKESELNWYFNIEEINTKGCCIEIRQFGNLIAVSIIVNNNLTFAAVSEEYQNDNLQVKLIKERIEFAKERQFDSVVMHVRCNNVPSWRNALKCGFKVSSQMRYDNDDEGFILIKQINQ
jgi:citrate lyase synthetase